MIEVLLTIIVILLAPIAYVHVCMIVATDVATLIQKLRRNKHQGDKK